jgi:CheY-like chemotaxis protein
MKHVLVIDESPLLQQYLREKCRKLGLEATLALNGLDGLSKIYSTRPDIIIMDFNLSRLKGTEIVEKKTQSPTVKDIPIVVITSSRVIPDLVYMKKHTILKIIPKPIKVDVLVSTLSEGLRMPLSVEPTPCVLDVHLNENVLFIEIARGLNTDKIEILKYKILELIQIFRVNRPKVLVIISDLKLAPADMVKLKLLFDTILEATGSAATALKVLTTSAAVKSFLAAGEKYRGVEAAERLEQILDRIFDLNVSQFISSGKSLLKQNLISPKHGGHTDDSELELKFHREQADLPQFFAEDTGRPADIAVVDDDVVIQDLLESAFSGTGWKIYKYASGTEFILACEKTRFDLVFLDILMPAIDGFGVMDYLKKKGIDTPVIVLSTVSQRNTILKAISFGVNSYLIKPLDVDLILKKTQSVFKRNF